MKTAAILAAGGSSVRFGKNKLLAPLANGKPLFAQTVDVFSQIDEIDEIVVVCRDQDLSSLQAFDFGQKTIRFAKAGETRAMSVKNGLLATTADLVLIHDGARPYLSPVLIKRVLDKTKQTGACVPVIPVTETVRTKDSTLPRKEIFTVQTPQGFLREKLLSAYKMANPNDFTDEAGLYEAAYRQSVTLVEGETQNRKVTFAQDIPSSNLIRSGIGYDAHRFQEGRKLFLCGVELQSDVGLVGHSDADAPLHALMDALLSAAGLPDIGNYFPPQDERFRGISSLLLLQKVVQELQNCGYLVQNVSLCVIAEAPKLKPYLAQMKEIIAQALQISPQCVGITATTNEGMGFVGRQEGIAAQAIATITKIPTLF